MKPQSLRLRLLLTYAGLIVLGFGGLALLAGQQISSAARRDYELRLTNEVILIARNFTEALRGEMTMVLSGDGFDDVLSTLSPRTDTHLELIRVRDGRNAAFGRNNHAPLDPAPEQGWPLPDDLQGYPELVAASRNAVTVSERNDENGRALLFTAAPVTAGSFFLGYLRLSEPLSGLQQAVNERWMVLGLGVLGITAVALLASFWLSSSLIRPLEKLRDSALRLSQGELSHRVVYQAQDEIGAVAHAFNQMAEQVQAMIEEQRAFASNASHELRTPLTTMRLRTEALRRDESMDAPTQRQYIVELDEELGRLSSLVEDLVLLSRFDARRAEIGQEQIDLVRFAHSLQQVMAEQAEEREIDLQLDVAAEGPVTANASLNHLTVLFRNLLDNAIKYTPPGGHVTWRVAVEGADAVFTIADTGQGIAAEHLPHVFERFYRADRSRSRSTPGTGLGLALARSIVESYGGRIVVASDGVGQGTTVTVRWPISAAAA